MASRSGSQAVEGIGAQKFPASVSLAGLYILGLIRLAERWAFLSSASN